MPFHVMVPENGKYKGVRTLRFSGPEDESCATVVLSNSILIVSHRGVIDKKRPALSPTDDGLPEKVKRKLNSIRQGEIQHEMRKELPDKDRIERIKRSVPILTTIAEGHLVQLRPLIPGRPDMLIDLGDVMGWAIH